MGDNRTMAKINKKRKDPLRPLGPENETRPERPGRSALFSAEGPVRMGADSKGIVSLGNIGPGDRYESRTTTYYKPSVPDNSIIPPPDPLPSAPEVLGMPYPVMPSRPETEPAINARVPSSPTSWSPSRIQPRIDSTSFVHPGAVIIGNVILHDRVFVAAGAVLRADNEEPIFVGSASNIQEGVILKDLPTRKAGKQISQRVVEVKGEAYSLYVGNRVTIAAQAQVHGPAYIADGVFVGMQSLVFWARVEKGVVIEPGCLIMNVTIPAGVFIPAGLKVTNQNMVKDLPPLSTKYRFHGIGEETVAAHLEMLDGYRAIYF